ncbi:sigma factor-like helix-turn-helix DNA-binding protein [Evansella cellulosilytica]|uniref:RNA polymerase sigma-70 region 4 domain-containing protein n=1 Tax=Evansella cellulosilytica (strain ATCC 21833 / DSM 2522 / FERM P-1141 / JCM 9156 / N-4) TaxID=649639 RepID=E6TU26_EVAC2|nr:sigma factor-like helix-turn-helix DNA-binding protein [Evansella cellulosilytica]ADU28486.1 hypothetical protein Bcell_0197 [Evansella cellulosilytica DSM 2522]
MIENQVSKVDMELYLDLIKAPYGQRKKYIQLLKAPESDQYRSFKRAYLFFKDNLIDREQNILDLVYRNNGELSLKEIGERIGISSSRVAAIRNLAERRLSLVMLRHLRGDDSPQKKSMYTIVYNLSDQKLIALLQITRPWEKNISYYQERGTLTTERRKTVRHKLYNVWTLDMNDHRDKMIKLLAINKGDIEWD